MTHPIRVCAYPYGVLHLLAAKPVFYLRGGATPSLRKPRKRVPSPPRGAQNLVRADTPLDFVAALLSASGEWRNWTKMPAGFS